MKILSFDCAHRTIAYIYCNIDADFLRNFVKKANEIIANLKNQHFNFMTEFNALISSEINEISLNKKLAICDDYLEKLKIINNELNIITILSSDVSDLLEKKVVETSKIYRAIKLKEYLNKIKIDSDSNILIESQPPFNKQSNAIFDQLVYNYCDKFTINFISAKMKNNIVVKDKTFNDFKSLYKNRYIAEKKYADYNKQQLEKLFNLTFIQVKKKCENHLSDAFTQIIAHILS